MSLEDLPPVRDEFLSDEDLDLVTMTVEELMAYWDLWFREAQATNETDQWVYSHGVLDEVPERART